MFGRNKNEPQKLQVDLGDLPDEKERLASFLQKHLKIEICEEKNKLSVDPNKVSLSDLHHGVKKFLYHRDLNLTHFTILESSTVKINRFKGHAKKKKNKHNKEVHQSISQTWGL